MKPLAVVVLISGYGSNLQAIINAAKTTASFTIKAVISNRADAYGLQRAKSHNIDTAVIEKKDFASRTQFDEALLQQVERYHPDLIVLAGYMLKLQGELIKQYQGKIINVHPALLPKYPGLKTHEKILKNGDTEHGLTIHYVDDNLDSGPIICQAKFTVKPAATEESLRTAVQKLEHQAYPLVIDWIANQRLKLNNNQVMFDNEALPKSGKLLNL